jgi:hypothetical protein
MQWLPTHVVDVLTGTTTNAYGDEVDGTGIAATGVPVSILQQSRLTNRQDNQTPRTVRTYTGRVHPAVAVSAGDRLRHNPTGTIWVVDDVTTNANPVAAPGQVMTLRKVTP